MFDILLEPCPFCGGPADTKAWGFKYKQGPRKGEKFQKYKIGCDACGIWQTDVKFAQDAAADWNRRVGRVK